MTDTIIDWKTIEWIPTSAEVKQAQVQTFVDGNQYVLLVVDLAEFDDPPEIEDQCQLTNPPTPPS